MLARTYHVAGLSRSTSINQDGLGAVGCTARLEFISAVRLASNNVDVGARVDVDGKGGDKAHEAGENK